jgi:spore maturation protein SpmB
MALFLAINTSNVTLLPTGVIALRAAAGSTDPAGILPTTLFATLGSTIVAVITTKLYARLASPDPVRVGVTDPPENGRTSGAAGSEPQEQRARENGEGGPDLSEADTGYPFWVSLVAMAAVLGLIPLTILYGRAISPWIIPSLMIGFLLFGVIRRVRIYEVFVEGAKDGFQVAVKIIPYLVAILVAVGMFRASGAMETMVGFLGEITAKAGLPAEALPMALLRPLSGSGAYGIMASIIQDPAVGPDSYVGYLVSTLQGSTETTFYVIAVYFGAVQIRRIRHTMAAALTADLAGIICAIIACSYFLG